MSFQFCNRKKVLNSRQTRQTIWDAVILVSLVILQDCKMNNTLFLYITDMLIPADKTPAILMR